MTLAVTSFVVAVVAIADLPPVRSGLLALTLGAAVPLVQPAVRWLEPGLASRGGQESSEQQAALWRLLAGQSVSEPSLEPEVIRESLALLSMLQTLDSASRDGGSTAEGDAPRDGQPRDDIRRVCVWLPKTEGDRDGHALPTRIERVLTDLRAIADGSPTQRARSFLRLVYETANNAIKSDNPAIDEEEALLVLGYLAYNQAVDVDRDHPDHTRDVTLGLAYDMFPRLEGTVVLQTLLQSARSPDTWAQLGPDRLQASIANAPKAQRKKPDTYRRYRGRQLDRALASVVQAWISALKRATGG